MAPTQREVGSGAARPGTWRRPAIFALVFLPVVGLGVLLVAVMVTMTLNNSRMDEWEQEFFAVDPPPGAVVVEQGSDFGLLEGNGNHCDRRAWILVRTDLPRSVVEEHYGRRFDDAHVLDGMRVDLDGDITAAAVEGDLVRVERFASGPAGLDVRCH